MCYYPNCNRPAHLCHHPAVAIWRFPGGEDNTTSRLAKRPRLDLGASAPQRPPMPLFDSKPSIQNTVATTVKSDSRESYPDNPTSQQRQRRDRQVRERLFAAATERYRRRPKTFFPRAYRQRVQAHFHLEADDDPAADGNEANDSLVSSSSSASSSEEGEAGPTQRSRLPPPQAIIMRTSTTSAVWLPPQRGSEQCTCDAERHQGNNWKDPNSRLCRRVPIGFAAALTEDQAFEQWRQAGSTRYQVRFSSREAATRIYANTEVDVEIAVEAMKYRRWLERVEEEERRARSAGMFGAAGL